MTVLMRLVGALLAVVFSLAACSTSSTVSSNSPRPSPSPSANTIPPTQVCFTTTPPADWSDAMSNLVASFEGVVFIPEALDERDQILFGEVLTAAESHVDAMDISTGKLTGLATGPARGIAWMTFADGWLAWPLDGAGGSSIQLWNDATHERRQIATSGAGEAVIGHGHVVWIETAGDQTFAIRAYDISSGKTTSLDSGVLQAPVFAGNFLVWAKGASQASFVFADASTLAATTVPAELRDVRGIAWLAGSPDRLVWTSAAGSRTWYADALAVNVLRAYGASSGHFLQFPNLAGPYLAWREPDKTSIVDLRSGIGFSLPLPGDLQAGGDTIVVERGSMLRDRAAQTSPCCTLLNFRRCAAPAKADGLTSEPWNSSSSSPTS